MGNGAEGGGRWRAGRQLGLLVAAAAGATVVVAAVASRRLGRRRTTAMSPENSLAGPAIDRTVRPAVDTTIGPSVDKVEAPGDKTPLVATAIVSVDPAMPSVSPESTVDTAPPAADAATTPVGGALLDHDPALDADLATSLEVGAPAGSATDAPAIGSDASPRRRSRAIAGVVAVVVVLLVGAGAMVAAGTGEDDPAPADAEPAPDATTSTRPTTTTLAPVAAADAFGLAAQRLTGAGSFTYTGTVSATDVSQARPMLWLAVEASIEGQVATSTGRLHEVAVTDDGQAAETVADGATVWGRRAPAVDELADERYEAIPALSEDGLPSKGAVLLPLWLAAAIDPTEVAADELGRRTFRGTIPADVLGEIERERRPVDATIVLTLDDVGDPVRVEITASPAGPPFHLLFELAGLGSPVAIEPPAPTPP